MDKKRKKLLSFAGKLCVILNEPQMNMPYLKLPCKYIVNESSTVVFLCDRLQLAIDNADSAAFETIYTLLQSAARRLRNIIASESDDLNVFIENTYPQPVSVEHVLRDLTCIQKDFGSFKYSDGKLSVVTEPITLAGDGIEISVGRFRIFAVIKQFRRKQAGARGIEVEALDRISEDNNPHPHVSVNDYICAGNWEEAAERCCFEGRLYEYFLLARQLLRNYDKDYAFCSLESYTSEPCGLCGGFGASHICSICEAVCCADCYSMCNCNNAVCNNCLMQCKICEDVVCPECSIQCDCGNSVCDNCAVLCGVCGNAIHGKCSSDCCECCTICGEPCCSTCITNGVCESCSSEEANEKEKISRQRT